MVDSPPRNPPAETARQRAYLARMGIELYVGRQRNGVTQEAAVPVAVRAAEAVPGPATGGRGQTPPGVASASALSGDDSDVAGLDWDALEQRIRQCCRCPLHETRTQGVPGVGSRSAGLMLIGEAPGAEEDRRGEPFVGKAGQLLDEMLRAIGLERAQVYITNILKSRPPGNRDPQPDEVAACEPYLRRQIELLQPALIVALGRISAQNLLRSNLPLGRLRGEWHAYGPLETPLLTTYHPAYLLRNPADKRKAWHDLKQIRSRLRQAASVAEAAQ